MSALDRLIAHFRDILKDARARTDGAPLRLLHPSTGQVIHIEFDAEGEPHGAYEQ